MNKDLSLSIFSIISAKKEELGPTAHHSERALPEQENKMRQEQLHNWQIRDGAEDLESFYLTAPPIVSLSHSLLLVEAIISSPRVCHWPILLASRIKQGTWSHSFGLAWPGEDEHHRWYAIPWELKVNKSEKGCACDTRRWRQWHQWLLRWPREIHNQLVIMIFSKESNLNPPVFRIEPFILHEN